MRCCRSALLSMSLLLVALAATAAPADDHRRGLAAFHRGDVTAAMAALRPAAKAGHAPSQALLAFILERADFMDEAVALYRAAAAQGDVDGHAGLAAALLAGRGVAKDEKAALAHFSKAADGGHEASMALLVQSSRSGRGLQPEREHAERWAVQLEALRQSRLAAAVAASGVRR